MQDPESLLLISQQRLLAHIACKAVCPQLSAAPHSKSQSPGTQVLRWFGYYKESIPESRIENHRIRKVVIHYYLDSDTLEVVEPKEPNSGLPQVCGRTSDCSSPQYSPG